MRALAILGLVSVLLSAPSAHAQGQRREGDLKEGARAPDFTLKDFSGKKTVKLADLRGKPAVLIFGSCT